MRIITISLLFVGCTASKTWTAEKVTAQLISNERTMRGYKHVFVSAHNDTLVWYMPKQFYTVGECYQVNKVVHDKK